MQSQFIATGDPVTSVSLQQIFQSLANPGVLEGNELIAVTSSILGVSPGTALTDSGVFIIESEVKQLAFTLTVSPQNYTVYYQYVTSKNFGGNPATLTMQTGLVEADGFVNGVVLGWVLYPGGSVPLNSSMFVSAPRFRLQQSPSTGVNSYINLFPPFDYKWTQVTASGPLTTVSTQYNSTYKAPITTLQNTTLLPLSATTWLIPFTVPDLGIGRIQVELQVDSGALATSRWWTRAAIRSLRS